MSIRHTPRDLQEQLDAELSQVTIEKVTNDIINEDAGDNLEIVELGEKNDEVRTCFSQRFVVRRRLTL